MLELTQAAGEQGTEADHRLRSVAFGAFPLALAA